MTYKTCGGFVVARIEDWVPGRSAALTAAPSHPSTYQLRSSCASGRKIGGERSVQLKRA